MAVADVYDALSSTRVYKDAYSQDVARSIIVEGAGKHFDPDVVGAFFACEYKFLAFRGESAADEGRAAASTAAQSEESSRQVVEQIACDERNLAEVAGG